MRINLNDENEFTIEKIRKLIASENDMVNTQFRVTDDGYLFLSKVVGNQKLEGIKLRLETNGAAGTEHIGLEASNDDLWVQKIYNVIKKNWPIPTCAYIDNY